LRTDQIHQENLGIYDAFCSSTPRVINIQSLNLCQTQTEEERTVIQANLNPFSEEKIRDAHEPLDHA